MNIKEVDWQDALDTAWFLEKYHKEVGWDHFTINYDKTYNQVISSITNEDEQVLVAKEGDQIIGVAWSLCMKPFFSDDLMIENLLVYVDKDKRGGMAGPRLMRHIKKWGKARGAKAVKIGTISEINTARTKGLFRKMGYREVGSHFMTEL